MALSISKATEYGVNASYWRIVGIFVDILRGQVVISVSAYLDETSRQTNKFALASLQVNCTPAQLEAETNSARGVMPAAYNLLKTLPEFSGSTDA